MYKVLPQKLWLPRHAISKLLLIMRLTTLILITAIMQVSASSYAQKISLSERNASLMTVLDRISTQTGYDFFFESVNLKSLKNISIQANNQELKDVLTKLLGPQNLSFSIKDNAVIIKAKEPSLLDRVISRLVAIDIRGKVVDETGQPLAGATIKVKGSNRTTKTNAQGEFSLQGVDENAIVEISFIGYAVQEVRATTNIGTISMRLADAKLEEVMINAGYYTVKDKERTGSIARITAKDIETQPVTNVLATMQGRMSGVQVIQDSGMPGGAFKIKIRGQNSLRADGNDPLYIIDGVPYSSETIGSTYTSGQMPSMTSPLNAINPTDIESIEILKDADATAIYGSRGANGVVLISTKKGKAGKTTFSINAATNRGKVTKMMELMRTPQYLRMREQAYANDGITTYPANAYDVNGTWDKNRYTDWQKELIGGTAETTNLQASVSGGSAHTQYLLSGNTWKETTVYPGAFKYKKTAAHFSMNHSSEDQRFQLVFSSGYTTQNNLQPRTDLTRIARALAPNSPGLYDASGNLNWENSTWQNPLASLESRFTAKTNDLNANAVLSYNLTPRLQLKSSFGFADLRNNENTTQPSTMNNPALGLGSKISNIYTNLTLRTSWIAEPQIKWTLNAGKSKIEALIGSTFQNQKASRLFQSGFGFSSNSLIYDLASATLKAIDYSDETVYKYQAIFARLNYNWDGKYIANITGRRDGSSRFGPGKQFANFGAMGVAWIFSRESLLKDQSILSFGKLRASFGITGNDQIGDYQYLDTYLSSGNAYQGVVGLQPTRLFNPDFAWETNKKLETAIEMGFFNDRLFLTSAFYSNRSSNQLVGIPLPGTTGFSSLTANLGATVQNNGLEFSLQTKNMEHQNFKWTTNFNISMNRNKLISYPQLSSSTYSNTYVVGKSINILKRYHYTGIDSKTGAYTFQDFNGDGQITSLLDRNVVVDLNPRFYGGLQNQLSYRGIQLDFLFQFAKQKADVYDRVLPGRAFNQPASLINTWQSEGDEAKYQKLTSGTNSALNTAYSRFNQSDGTIEDASFIRLKNMALSYEVPAKTLAGINCRVYLQAQNLLTFTAYKSGDPEFKFGGYLPPLRVYTAGLQLTF